MPTEPLVPQLLEFLGFGQLQLSVLPGSGSASALPLSRQSSRCFSWKAAGASRFSMELSDPIPRHPSPWPNPSWKAKTSGAPRSLQTSTTTPRAWHSSSSNPCSRWDPASGNPGGSFQGIIPGDRPGESFQGIIPGNRPRGLSWGVIPGDHSSFPGIVLGSHSRGLSQGILSRGSSKRIISGVSSRGIVPGNRPRESFQGIIPRGSFWDHSRESFQGIIPGDPFRAVVPGNHPKESFPGNHSQHKTSPHQTLGMFWMFLGAGISTNPPGRARRG